MTARSKTRGGIVWTRVIVALWLVLPGALGLALAGAAALQWWQAPPDVAELIPGWRASLPLLRLRLAAVVTLAVGLTGLLGLRVAHELAGDRPLRPIRRRLTDAGVVLGSISPALVRVAISWEDPYTGDGSPLAVLLGVAFFGISFGLVFGLPAAWLVMSSRRAPSSDGRPSPWS